MRKTIIIFLLISLLALPVMAFLYEVKILSREDIEKLTEEQLLQTYIEAVIERRASETFHGKAGFTPKEYNSFKQLLGMIVKLRYEMMKRKIEVPPVDEWIK